MIDLEQYFEVFIERISLGRTPVRRIESATKALTEYVNKHLVDDLGFSSVTCYQQGSFATDTAIESLEGGEYDVDLVIESESWAIGSNTALSQLFRIVNQHGTYHENVTQRTPCVRVDYVEDSVGKFHVDLVPARPLADHIEVPRWNEGWHESSSKAFIEWSQALGSKYQNMVKLLKRWRDVGEKSEGCIKSIVLQVLIGSVFEGFEGKVDLSLEPYDSILLLVVTSLVERMESDLNAPIWNPVLPGEDLGIRWAAEDRNRFLDALKDTLQKITETAGLDKEEQLLVYAEIFGSDFLLNVDAKLVLQDLTHEEKTRNRGWHLDPDCIELPLEVFQLRPRGKLRKVNRKIFVPDVHLKFATDKSSIPSGADLWWQVTNTGIHAKQANCLRGEFIRSRQQDGSFRDNSVEHWETTIYHGVHRVRVIAVRDDRVVAKSKYLQVAVSNRNWLQKLKRK